MKSLEAAGLTLSKSRCWSFRRRSCGLEQIVTDCNRLLPDVAISISAFRSPGSKGQGRLIVLCRRGINNRGRDANTVNLRSFASRLSVRTSAVTNTSYVPSLQNQY